jgi:hypothetical protein
MCQWREELRPCRRVAKMSVGSLGVCRQHLLAAQGVHRDLKQAAVEMEQVIPQLGTVERP